MCCETCESGGKEGGSNTYDSCVRVQAAENKHSLHVGPDYTGGVVVLEVGLGLQTSFRESRSRLRL